MKTRKRIIKNVFYNTYGTFFYFFCQWLITVLVVRLSGYKDAGVLSIIISTCNIFYCFALFGVRSYQISDVNVKYSDNDYIYMRIITVSISLLLFLCSLFFLNFDTRTLLCCLIYIVYKSEEAFSDVFFGCYQKYSKYKSIAISYTLKGLATVISFSIVLFFTKDLLLTLIMNVIVYFFIFLFYDVPNLKHNFKIAVKSFNYKKLLHICFPLMLYGCMVPYLNFITRFVIEKQMGTEVLGYYSSVTMIFVVISTLMGSVFVSIIPKIASLYYEKQFRAIKSLIINLVFFILLLMIIGCIIGYFAGDFIFALVFGDAILDYMYLLIPTIIASIALTLSSFFSSILISFKENKAVLLCNLVAIIVSTVSVFCLVQKFSLVGTLYCLIISLVSSSILLLLFILKKLG